MQFNITFKTIFEYILKKLVLCIQIRFVSTENKYRKKLRASPRVHLVLIVDDNIQINLRHDEKLNKYIISRLD